jgi:hypothetical protein
VYNRGAYAPPFFILCENNGNKIEIVKMVEIVENSGNSKK